MLQCYSVRRYTRLKNSGGLHYQPVRLQSLAKGSGVPQSWQLTWGITRTRHWSGVSMGLVCPNVGCFCCSSCGAVVPLGFGCVVGHVSWDRVFWIPLTPSFNFSSEYRNSSLFAEVSGCCFSWRLGSDLVLVHLKLSTFFIPTKVGRR